MTILRTSALVRAIVRGSIVRADSGGGGGWTPPGATFPTTFSPTARGGVGTGFGIYATTGLRTVAHDASANWFGVRTVHGITTGQKISCWATLTTSTNDAGLGLGNASADLESYSGGDANGLVCFLHVSDVYSSGAPIASTTGVGVQNDRIRMDVDRVNNTVRFWRQTGGTGSYVSMTSAIDISFLGSGTLYPISNSYTSAATLVWDFGNGSETPASGFTAGPVGDLLPWSYPMLDGWLHSDTKRMFQQASDYGAVSPNVTTAGNPIGAWGGITYSYLRSNATASARLEYQTAGALYDSSGATKYFPANYSRAYNDPFYAVIRCKDMSAQSPAFGAAASASLATMRVGFSSAASTVQPRVNGVSVTTAGAAMSADNTVAISYDGTNYIVVDSDGTVYTGAAGSGTTATDVLHFRALTATAGVGKIVYMQNGATALTEDELRNLHYVVGQLS